MAQHHFTLGPPLFTDPPPHDLRDAAADILRGVSDDVGGMVERQAPGVLDDFRNANTAYRNSKILESAVGKAMNTDGVFTPAQLGMAARENAKKFGRRYASEERPFFDLQRAGQQILPSKVPDSGTAGRQATGDGLLGVVRGFSHAARTPLYSDPVLDLMNITAYSRPEAAQSLGEIVRKNGRYLGMFGAPAASFQAVR